MNDWKTKPGPVAAEASSPRRRRGWLIDSPSSVDLAGRRPVEAAEELEERDLAGAGRAHQGDELARDDRERHAAQRVDGRRTEPVALREVARLEDRRASPAV